MIVQTTGFEEGGLACESDSCEMGKMLREGNGFMWDDLRLSVKIIVFTVMGF